MEMKKTYNVNIISIDETLGHFIIIEQFSSDATDYFLKYYKQLLSYNKCSKWFEKLDYPHLEIGNVIVVQSKEATNLWARGIISKKKINDSSFEIYLIDSQRFCDNYDKLEMRVCPTTFLNLKLPTYNIDVNIDLTDDHFKKGFQKLIWKNQCGKLNFCFTPKSLKNNVYSGELNINNKTDHTIVPLKKFLKNFQKKKCLPDTSKNDQFTFSTFNPLKLKYLENIFIPSDLNSINCDKVTKPEIKEGSIDSQSIEMNVKEEDNFIKTLMRKRYSILSNMSTSNGYKEHNDSTITSDNLEMSKTPSIVETKNQTINSLADDSNIWWSSDEDEK